MLAFAIRGQADFLDSVDVLTHQKWSGAAYVDGMLGAYLSFSTVASGLGVTRNSSTFHS